MSVLPFRPANSLILVVDDIEFNQQLIASALKKSGFTNIETATDGAETLEKTYRLNPDMVILDLRMPNMNGLEYCERIRSDKRFAFMPIVVQTISEEREDKLRALSCGADDFLRKPIDQEELVLRARLHLERRAMLLDMEDMCQYFAMELEETQKVIHDLQIPTRHSRALAMLDKHCEVLKALATLNKHY